MGLKVNKKTILKYRGGIDVNYKLIFKNQIVIET